jgi:hypothetical protein
MKKSLTISLMETKFDRHHSTESLGELLEQVVAILNPKGHARSGTNARWVARWAIRAFCEEVIRNGCMWCPPEVTFSNYWCKRAKGFRFQASRN